ncbi:MAG: CbiX/SirB N-terminal domain-containing protein [Dehalococcoidia bacterium]
MPPKASPTALVLAAHGSHLDPGASEPAWRLANAVRRAGRFAAVRAAFWKEEPSFARALDGLDAHAVRVLPLFLAPGYFTTEVLPRELAPAIAARSPAGPPVTVLPPIGTAPAMARIVGAVARDSGHPPTATLIVLGHGTDRHGGAAANLASVVERVRALDTARRVEAAFIDQQPELVEVARAIGGPVVVVPFFLAAGWHVGTTIPADLRNAGVDSVWLTTPVGELSDMVEAVLEAAG